MSTKNLNLTSWSACPPVLAGSLLLNLTLPRLLLLSPLLNFFPGPWPLTPSAALVVNS